MESYDVLIIGAGPAGSVSSYYLSKKGLKVGLIEKNDIGKDKICGGGISNYAINELPYRLPSRAIERTIKGVSFISPNHEIFKKKEKQVVGATVYRSVFDSYLLEKAIDAGVSFIPHTKVKKIDKISDSYVVEGKYKATYIVGADGANSVVKNIFNLGIKQQSRFIGIRSFMTIRQEDFTSHLHDQECIELYFKNRFNGYGWVFPLQNTVNIGLGFFGKGPKSKLLLNDFLLHTFHLPKHVIKMTKIEGYPIPITKLPKKFSKDKVFLVGDAAGLVDPVSGEGIHYAIRSGKIVADTILKDYNESLHGKLDDLYNYRMKNDIITDLLIAYRLRTFLSYVFMNSMELWFKLMKRNPMVFSYVPELAKNSSYYYIYKDMLKNSPILALNTFKGNNKLPGFTISSLK